MKIRHSNKPLPRCFSGLSRAGGIVCEADIKVTDHGKLRAKLLVFKNTVFMQNFFRDVIKYPALGRFAEGAVQEISEEEGDTILVDPRYFCIIALTLKNLSCEVITHESVHAGNAFNRRRRGNIWPNANGDNEENIAYPTGVIASQINNILHDRGIYKDSSC